jgi:hypothetical protein
MKKRKGKEKEKERRVGEIIPHKIQANQIAPGESFWIYAGSLTKESSFMRLPA